MDNIVLIGAGKRVLKTIAPAIINNNYFNISQIISKNSGKKINISSINSTITFTTDSIEQIKLKGIKYLYLGVTANQISKVLKKITKKIDLKDIILLIDTPPIYIKDLLRSSNFSAFKKVIILEDWPYFLTHKIYEKLISEGLLGKLKTAYFFHNSYKYHTLSLIRFLFKINNFSLIFKKKQNAGFYFLNIFSGINNICNIQDPRNYDIGRFLLKGSNGSISDYEINTNSKSSNFYTKYRIKENTLLGIDLYLDKNLYHSYYFKKQFIFKNNIKNSEVHAILKINALDEIFTLIALDKYKNEYTLEDGIYDYLAFYLVDKFKIFIDIPIPFTKLSIVSILIKLILKLNVI